MVGKMLDAAKAMKLSSKDLLDLGIIDEIISEPLGGAHRDKSQTLEKVRSVIRQNIQTFKEMSSQEIINQRHVGRSTKTCYAEFE